MKYNDYSNDIICDLWRLSACCYFRITSFRIILWVHVHLVPVFKYCHSCHLVLSQFRFSSPIIFLVLAPNIRSKLNIYGFIATNLIKTLNPLLFPICSNSSYYFNCFNRVLNLNLQKLSTKPSEYLCLSREFCICCSIKTFSFFIYLICFFILSLPSL